MLAAATAAMALLLIAVLLVALSLLEGLLLLLTAAVAGVHAAVCCWLAWKPKTPACLPIARSDRLHRIHVVMGNGRHGAASTALLC
jgi:hypothetical protein